MMEDTRQRGCKSVHGLVSFFEDLSKGQKEVISVRSKSDGRNSILKSSNILKRLADLPKSSSNDNSSKLFVENERCKISLEKNVNPEKLSYPENHGHTFDLQSDTNPSNKKVAHYEDLSKSNTDIPSLKPSGGPISVSISPYIDQQSAEFSKPTPLMVTSPKCYGENENCKESFKKNENPEKLSPEDHPTSLKCQNNANHVNMYKDNIKNNEQNSNRVLFMRSQSLTQLPTISEANSPQMQVRSYSRENVKNESSVIKAPVNVYGEGNVHGAGSVSASYVSESNLRRSESANSLKVKDCPNMTINMITGPGFGGECSSVEQQQSIHDYNSGIPTNSTSTNSGIASITDRAREMKQSHHISSKFKNTSERFLEANKILKKKGLLIIMCNPGDGSTYLGLELLLSYKEYLKDFVNDVSELRDLFKHKSIAMLDNACGGTPSSFSRSEYGELLKIIEIHRRNFVKGGIKLIIIIKNSNKENCKELLEELENNILNLSNQSFQLNVNEKNHIITQCIKCQNHDNDKAIQIQCTEPDKHLTDKTIPKISQTNKKDAISISEYTLSEIARQALSIGFPKQVHTFLSDEHNMLQGVYYFIDPTDTLQSQINAIADTDNYVALIAVFVFIELDQDTIKTLSDPVDEHNHKSSCHIILDVFNKHKRNVSLRECVHHGVEAFRGTFINKTQRNTFTFSAKAVKTAIMLNLAKEFQPYILKELDDRLFNKFVCTDTAPEDLKKSKSQICINPDDKKTVKYVLKRLETTAMKGDLRTLVAHPLMQDKFIAQKFLESITKKRHRTRQLYLMKDLTTQQTLIRHGLKFLFFNNSPKDDNCNMAVMILLSRKWQYIRKEPYNFQWAMEQERLVIDDCFRDKLFGPFIALMVKLHTLIEPNNIIGCVKSGMQSVLRELLELDPSKRMLSLKDWNEAYIQALETFCKDSTDTRWSIIEMIVNLDYKIDRNIAIPIAGKYGNIQLLSRALQKLNVDINAVDDYKRTCIHWAAINEHITFIEFVAEASIDPSVDQLLYDSSGYLAIHHAAEHECEDSLKILYNHDKHVINEPEQQHGMQPLHIAALNNKIKIAAFLIEHNADTNAKDINSITPLHYAAKSGKCGVMLLLLKANVNINVKDKNSNTPLQYAAKFDNHEGLRLLLKA